MKNKTKIFIDNNIWDLLFELNIDLKEELPTSQFQISITGEGEIEINGMPSDLKKFVQHSLRYIEVDKYFGYDEYGSQVGGYNVQPAVTTDKFFGFGDLNNPEAYSNLGGFGTIVDDSVGGRFTTDEESDFFDEESSIIGPQRTGSGLLKHEADVSLAARSLYSIVLTKDKKGILNRVSHDWGGKVIDMNDFNGNITLKEYIEKQLL